MCFSKKCSRQLSLLHTEEVCWIMHFKVMYKKIRKWAWLWEFPCKYSGFQTKQKKRQNCGLKYLGYEMYLRTPGK